MWPEWLKLENLSDDLWNKATYWLRVGTPAALGGLWGLLFAALLMRQIDLREYLAWHLVWIGLVLTWGATSRTRKFKAEVQMLKFQLKQYYSKDAEQKMQQPMTAGVYSPYSNIQGGTGSLGLQQQKQLAHLQNLYLQAIQNQPNVSTPNGPMLGQPSTMWTGIGPKP